MYTERVETPGISLQIARDPRHDMLSRFFVINSIINERNIEIMLFLQRKH